MEMEGKKVMDLKNSHKSKKAPANPLRLSADRETAIHRRSILNCVHKCQGERV